MFAPVTDAASADIFLLSLYKNYVAMNYKFRICDVMRALIMLLGTIDARGGEARNTARETTLFVVAVVCVWRRWDVVCVEEISKGWNKYIRSSDIHDRNNYYVVFLSFVKKVRNSHITSLSIAHTNHLRV